jgi:TPP-dependent trihydroxycyclohexane-1,2-dione (THcHDO) dehydratase
LWVATGAAIVTDGIAVNAPMATAAARISFCICDSSVLPGSTPQVQSAIASERKRLPLFISAGDLEAVASGATVWHVGRHAELNAGKREYRVR